MLALESSTLYPVIAPPPSSKSDGGDHCALKDESPLVRLIVLGAPAAVIGVAVIVENAPWQTAPAADDIPAHCDI